MRRELGHDLEVLRQTSDRKLEEMERANRKLMDQLHEDKKELARLKEVSTSIFDYKEGNSLVNFGLVVPTGVEV